MKSVRKDSNKADHISNLC